MTDLWEELILPFLCIFFGVVFIILSAVGIVGGTQAIFDAKECKVWGGEYHISTGCLMKVDNKMLTLKDYRILSLTEKAKPIETNMNIRIKQGETK